MYFQVPRQRPSGRQPPPKGQAAQEVWSKLGCCVLSRLGFQGNHVVQAASTLTSGGLFRRNHSCTRSFQGHRQRGLVWSQKGCHSPRPGLPDLRHWRALPPVSEREKPLKDVWPEWVKKVSKLPQGSLSSQAIEQLTISGLSRDGQTELENHSRLRELVAWQDVQNISLQCITNSHHNQWTSAPCGQVQSASCGRPNTSKK